MFLSDSTSQFLQHPQALLLVLCPAQPEGVLVLHDVGQHGAALEHHVFTTGRVFDADPKLLHRKSEKTEDLKNMHKIGWTCIRLRICTFFLSKTSKKMQENTTKMQKSL